MRKAFIIFTCAVLAFPLLGCASSKTRAVEGAVVGGGVGALAGGIIGHQSGHGAEGAGIGLAAGALTGTLVGSQIDKPQAQTASAAAASSGQMSVQDVVDLVKQGLSDDAVVAQIRATGSLFNLSAAQTSNLKQQGVSQKVIDAMLGK